MDIKIWIISTVSILIAAYLIPGVETSIIGAIIFAIVLGIINTFIKPIVALLTLPITFFTLGLFYLVLNAGFIMLAAGIVPNFYVAGFWSALFFSIIVSLINALLTPPRRTIIEDK